MASHLKEVLGERRWTIEDVSILRTGGSYLPQREAERLVGQSVVDVRRRGKYLVFVLDGGLLVGHNAMSGYWDTAERPWTFDYVEGAREATESDVRVKLRVSPSGLDGPSERILRFHDARLFGSLRFYAGARHWMDVPSLEKLGPDAIETRHGFPDTGSWSEVRFTLFQTIRKSFRDLTVKEALMNQAFVAGVGNIYAAEALWAAELHPTRTVNDLTLKEMAMLVACVRSTLRYSIDTGVDYSEVLNIYRQKTCMCGETIGNVSIKGRSSYFCPKCQPVR